MFNKIKQRSSISKIDNEETTKLSLELREIVLGDSISKDSLCKKTIIIICVRS